MSARLVADSVELVSLCRASPGDLRRMGPAAARDYLSFRLAFCAEELGEASGAHLVGDAEGVVDGLVDLVVVALGTLVALGVDADRAWRAVHAANMAKAPGVNPRRPNPLGLPDLLKPDGWVPPDHSGNHGLLPWAYAPEGAAAGEGADGSP